MGADEADPQPRILPLERLGDADVVGERRRARVEHGQLVVARERRHVVEREARGGRVDEAAAGHERRGLREPGRIPERADLAAGLIARAGAAVEALERWWMQEERLEKSGHSRLSYLIHPEGTAAGDAEQTRAGKTRHHALPGAPHAHHPDAPAARPGLA